MPKLKALYLCQQCAYQSVKWVGRCPQCSQWNTFVEEVVDLAAPSNGEAIDVVPPTLLAEVSLDDAARLHSGIDEFDRVLGGGIVPSSVTLVGGEPGIGKSTLLLSIAGALTTDRAGAPPPSARVGDERVDGRSESTRRHSTLYVSGEESLRQTKLRAARLGLGQAPIHLLAHTQLEVIREAIIQLKPEVVILDSIQVVETTTLHSAPGSIGQVRACAHELVRLAKETHMALFLVGHVTKEGALAGPKVLEHLVDTVLYFEGEPTSGFRLLRSTKNRFGATYELGVFQMASEGLVPILNPSELFLSDRTETVPGCMVTATLEGSRPLLVEIQALTSPCGIGLPRRRTAGIDFNRLSMLLAVLERRVGLHLLPQQDVFVSSLGGVRVVEPAADLGIALAIASSVKERPTRQQDLAIGEVGLTGEVRPVSNVAQRIHEATRVGFQRCLVAAPRGKISWPEGIEIVPIHHVREAVAAAFG